MAYPCGDVLLLALSRFGAPAVVLSKEYRPFLGVAAFAFAANAMGDTRQRWLRTRRWRARQLGGVADLAAFVGASRIWILPAYRTSSDQSKSAVPGL